jgi:hypothetical protein
MTVVIAVVSWVPFGGPLRGAGGGGWGVRDLVVADDRRLCDDAAGAQVGAVAEPAGLPFTQPIQAMVGSEP